MSKRRSQGDGTLYYDAPRGRWVGQVWIGGHRRKVTARTKRGATEKLGALIHGDEIERTADRRATVRSLLDDWQTSHLEGRTLAPSTREAHRWGAAHLAEQIGGVKLAALDVHAVERALRTLSEPPHGLSKASLVKIRSTLRQALNWAERRRIVTHNPAANAELPTKYGPGRTRRALTPDELTRLFEALDGHPLSTMYELSGHLGLRPGEAAGVCVDALDLDGAPPTIAVVRAVQLVAGRPVLTDELKTRHARRTIAMPVVLAERLAPVAAAAGAGLLYRAPDGGPVWPSTGRTVLAEACEAAGLARLTPNELRHTAATHLADGGLPPHQVADLLGHTTTRMLDQTYRHRPPVILGAH